MRVEKPEGLNRGVRNNNLFALVLLLLLQGWMTNRPETENKNLRNIFSDECLPEKNNTLAKMERKGKEEKIIL